jgi:hypothetical protein
MKRMVILVEDELFWKMKALAVERKQTVTKIVTDEIEKLVGKKK